MPARDRSRRQPTNTFRPDFLFEACRGVMRGMCPVSCENAVILLISTPVVLFPSRGTARSTSAERRQLISNGDI